MNTAITRPYGLETIPSRELERFWEYVNDHSECFDLKRSIRTFKKYGCKVIPDAFGAGISKAIAAKLKRKTPFSVIRIGDAEANILAYRAYPGTPNLDRHVIAVWAQTHLDNRDDIEISDLWFVLLRELMMLSVLEADVIGCRNLSKLTQYFQSAEELYHFIPQDYPRGAVGIFRSTDYLLRLSTSRRLSGKIIGNAHLYISIITHLDMLFQHVSEIICITSQKAVVDNLSKAYPSKNFTWVSTRQLIDPMINTFHQQNKDVFDPSFIVDVESSLPQNLHGVLCLVGAGCFAEIYCTMIKRRNGMAIDIGSGFDLLAGKPNRPIHHDLIKRGLLKNIPRQDT